jgi:hypothetical protein
MTMLHYANRTYAKNSTEMMESLFTGPTTPSGFYKKRANGWLLLDLQERPIAFVVANQKQGYFAVTAWRTEDGQVRYMNALDSITHARLGLEGIAYPAKKAFAEQAHEA